ncbi:MBL fold metallo-hydrolase [Thalassotalea sp. LPB0316]|uniref:MBL fold metallo-hydrolase n=1 Tax=Thalassotalea sp. LPB0316 TaxID=2769490 RepID=UPI0018683EB1|nr:MBL fold metallo-hydrolase [Thalassotalea sp. LPB0316]QOL26441.1 MBL fold metallo-hydrolase [Thalassotalea sp. LPB0316]
MLLNWFSLIFKLITAFIAIILLVILCALAYVSWAPIFGGSPDAKSLEKMTQSPNFDGEKFINLTPTVIATPSDTSQTIWATLFDLLSPPPDKNPRQPLPSQPLTKLDNGDYVWLGHSTVLFKQDDLTVITDPIFYRASPVFFGGKPFAQKTPTTPNDLPKLDVVMISHDHYDHLDNQTIAAIDDKVTRYLVPLGIKGHLQRWGVASSKITELDWYQSTQIEQVKFTLTPSRHFSGRGLTDRFATLWGSWVVQSSKQSIYFSGDGGYSEEFSKIGELFGPFDIAFLEDGAYNRDWSQIHMFPEQTVQAAVDLKASVVLPIHWAKYDLARHRWTEPIERTIVAAKERNVALATPIIGQVFTLERYPDSAWWRNMP